MQQTTGLMSSVISLRSSHSSLQVQMLVGSLKFPRAGGLRSCPILQAGAGRKPGFNASPRMRVGKYLQDIAREYKSSGAKLVIKTSLAPEPKGYPYHCGKSQRRLLSIFTNIFCCFGVLLTFCGSRGTQCLLAPLPLAQSLPPNSLGHKGYCSRDQFFGRRYPSKF